MFSIFIIVSTSISRILDYRVFKTKSDTKVLGILKLPDTECILSNIHNYVRILYEIALVHNHMATIGRWNFIYGPFLRNSRPFSLISNVTRPRITHTYSYSPDKWRYSSQNEYSKLKILLTLYSLKLLKSLNLGYWLLSYFVCIKSVNIEKTNPCTHIFLVCLYASYDTFGKNIVLIFPTSN